MGWKEWHACHGQGNEHKNDGNKGDNWTTLNCMITVIATSCDKCFQVAISIATIVDIDFHQTFSKIRSHLNKFKNKIYKSDLMMK